MMNFKMFDGGLISDEKIMKDNTYIAEEKPYGKNEMLKLPKIKPLTNKIKNKLVQFSNQYNDFKEAVGFETKSCFTTKIHDDRAKKVENSKSLNLLQKHAVSHSNKARYFVNSNLKGKLPTNIRDKSDENTSCSITKLMQFNHVQSYVETAMNTTKNTTNTNVEGINYKNDKKANEIFINKRIKNDSNRKFQIDTFSSRSPILQEVRTNKCSGRNQPNEMQFNPLCTSKANENNFLSFVPQQNNMTNKILDCSKTSESHDMNNENTIKYLEANSLNYSYNNWSVIDTAAKKQCKNKDKGIKNLSCFLQGNPHLNQVRDSNITIRSKRYGKDDEDTILVIGESGKTTKRIDGSELTFTNVYNNEVIPKTNDSRFKSKSTIKASHSNSIMKILANNTPSNSRLKNRNCEQLRSNSQMIRSKNEYAEIAKKYLSYKKLNSNNSDIKIVNEEANEGSILNLENDSLLEFSVMSNSNKKNEKLNNSGFSFKDVNQAKTQMHRPIPISDDSLLSDDEGMDEVSLILKCNDENKINCIYSELKVQRNENVFLTPNYSTPSWSLKPSVFSEHWILAGKTPELEYFNF